MRPALEEAPVKKNRSEPREDRDDPIETAIFLAVLIAGMLLIHAFVFRIW